MPEENVHLPLTITPEELEMAEIAVLLDFLRENAAQHDVSELREQALAVGYRESVVERAVADFDEELQSFLLETEPEPAPEPLPVRAGERPRPAASPIPAPPPPKVPAFLERLAETERTAQKELAPSGRPAPAGLALLIIAINAAMLSLAFTGHADMAILAYSAEIVFALLLARLQKTYRWQRAEELQTEGVASPVHSEPSRTPVPALPHEARTETPQTPRIPQRTPSRD